MQNCFCLWTEWARSGGEENELHIFVEQFFGQLLLHDTFK